VATVHDFPPQGRPKRSGASARDRRRRLILGAVIVVIVVVVALLGRLASLYIDWLWFGEVGQRGVFWTAISWRVVVALIVAAVFFVVIYVNVEVARRLAPDYPRVSPEGDLIEPSDERLKKLVRWGGLAVAVVAGAVVGYSMSADWLTYALALRAGEWGTTDAQFGRDLSFYVFSLPALQSALSLLIGAVVAAAVATGIAHLLLGGIEYHVDAGKAPPSDGPIRAPQRPNVDVKLGGRAVAHLSALFAAIFALVGVGQLFKAWDLLFSPGGVVFGATWTDVNVRLPVARVTLVLALALAVFLVVNVWRRRQWWPVIALGIWVAALVVLRGIVPAVVQQLVVNPNELDRERPYITRNLEATRAAFNLDIIEQQDFPAARRLEGQDLAEDPGTLRNIRLWDPDTLRRSYTQLQQLRPYYQFPNVDIDRYTIDDTYRQTMLAARELNLDGLPQRARTWVNEHITYTHGFGVAMSAVNQVTADGSPDFLIQDVPPRTVAGLELTQPRIYYGEVPADYKLVRTTEREFDYPGAAGDVFTEYEGTGGIEISPFLQRLAFCWRFGTIKFFTTSAIRDDSRIVIRNDIMSRVQTLAPFLTYDNDPYMVVSDGRLVWIVDAYTTTDRYPYSEPTADVNYVRNSVKVVVDAYDGSVKLHVFDDQDPVLQAYRAVYPDLFVSREEMSSDLTAHVRYPEDLFNIQAEVWTTYHVESPDVLYNKGDQWQIPVLEEMGDDGRMRGYYVIMRLPGEERDEYLQIIPFNPNERPNMVAWLGARSDMPNYGTSINYVFPEGVTQFGPSQVEAAINADPAISAQRTLWNQQGSNVIMGNLLVVPIADSILYVQPLYLEAEATQLPQLKRVIVFYRAPAAEGVQASQSVSMQNTLGEALTDIFGPLPEEGQEAVGGAPEGEVPGEEVPGEQPPEEAPPAAGANVSQLVQQANQQFDAALQAQRVGDWAEYGRQLDALEQTLQQLQELQSAQ